MLPDSTATALLAAGTAANTMAAAAGWLRRASLARLWFLIGWLCNAVLFALLWIAAGEPPFASMYHVMVFLGLCLLPLWEWFARRDGLAWLMPGFALLAALVLASALAMPKIGTWNRVPALRSPWFVPHVAAYTLSYALAALGFLLVLLRAIRRLVLGDRATGPWLDASFLVLRLGFPFMTFGLVSGALWADQVWGEWWSWDPKETWALITWLLYAMALYGHHSPSWKRLAEPAQVLAFLALLITFLLVNLWRPLASPLHGYT